MTGDKSTRKSYRSSWFLYQGRNDSSARPYGAKRASCAYVLKCKKNNLSLLKSKGLRL
jgi:hypothetical protein